MKLMVTNLASSRTSMTSPHEKSDVEIKTSNMGDMSDMKYKQYVSPNDDMILEYEPWNRSRNRREHDP